MVVVVLLVAPATAAAKLAPISGTLSQPGYTVLALAANGKMTSAYAGSGSFSLRPPDGRVTLQLRAPDGVYAGPIVVGVQQRGKLVIGGVKAGGKLGKIEVFVRKGYAKVKRTLAKRWLDVSRWAQAKKGVPIGNGRNFGFVRSKTPRVPPPGDLDADSVPDVLDIDVNGNLILNKFDRSGVAAHAAAVPDKFGIQSFLGLSLDQTANADAAGLTAQQADAALSGHGVLGMGILPGDSPELDCGQPQSRTNPALGGLIYCTKGGTGRFDQPNGPLERQPFPDDFLDPATGFGKLTPSNPQPAPGSGLLVMMLFHGATSDQIGTGDLLIQRVTRDGVVLQFPATIPFIFDTAPALVSYNDQRGNGATVHYPVAAPDPQTGMGGGPGTGGNPFPVTAGPNGDVSVTLTFWRPQRKPIPPDTNGNGGDACLKDNPPCQWIDIGHLNYSTVVMNNGSGCPQDAYSTSDRNLRPLTTADVFPASYTGLKDLAADQAASPKNTFTFTLDLTRCLAAIGATFNPGETVPVSFNTVTPNGTDSATQGLSFKRQ